METENTLSMGNDELLLYAHETLRLPKETNTLIHDGSIYIDVYGARHILRAVNPGHVIADNYLQPLSKRSPDRPGHVRRHLFAPRVYYYCLVDLMQVRVRDRPGMESGYSMPLAQKESISAGQRARHQSRPVKGTYTLSEQAVANIQDGRRKARSRRLAEAKEQYHEHDF